MNLGSYLIFEPLLFKLYPMSEDFDYIKKNREEWKKQLEAKFRDIERSLESDVGTYKTASNL